MKAITAFMTVAMMLMIASTAKAQDAKANLRNFGPKPKTESFKVYGECSICKHRIENALKVDGIKSATWDEDSKILTVQYILTADITGLNKIEQIVAAAGHDNEKYKAPDEVYLKLPLCCHYERKK
jgi:heavy-metal-associated domain-containing protein